LHTLHIGPPSTLPETTDVVMKTTMQTMQYRTELLTVIVAGIYTVDVPHFHRSNRREEDWQSRLLPCLRPPRTWRWRHAGARWRNRV